MACDRPARALSACQAPGANPMNHRAASNSIHVLSRVVCALALALLAPTGAARTVFFDGFDGPDFHPRWSTVGPSGGVWTYDFADSMFNLRSVTAQAPGQIPWRDVGFSTRASFEGDFSVSARVGWAGGGPARSIGIQVPGAIIGMDEWLRGSPTFEWSLAGGVRGTLQAPRAAFVTLTVERIGRSTRALIDGSEVARTTTVFPGSPGFVIVNILGDSRSMQPLHVDWIAVIPPPATSSFVGSIIMGVLGRKRRRSHARYLG